MWQDGPGPRATTIAFVAIVLIHPFQAMHCRSPRRQWWRLPVNPLSWMALAVLVALQWIAVGEAAKAWGSVAPLGHARPTGHGPEPGGRGQNVRKP